MREIKFRGKSQYDGEWVYGFGVGIDKYENDHFIQIKIDDYEFVEKETIDQFTGLYDKNGKEIYEGDKIKIDKGEYTVIYFNGSFGIDEKIKLSFYDDKVGFKFVPLYYYMDEIIEVINEE